MLNDFDVEILFSNKGLLPWEGGCLWEREGQKPLIQLRKSFEKKSHFLGIYSKEEIIRHELIHAQRLGINGPIFEEILAYQTSSFRFRRYLGPLFRSSKESLFFILSVATLLFTPWFFMGVSFYYIFRLIYFQRLFSKAKKKLSFETLITLDDASILKIAKTGNVA